MAQEGTGAAGNPAWLTGLYGHFHALQNWLVVGLVLILGWAMGKLSGFVRVPRVVGYLLLGVVLGQSVLDVISESGARTLELVTDFGLGVVAFMIGTELSGKLIRKLGRRLMIIMVCESLAAFGLVTVLMLIASPWAFPVAGMAVAGALVFGAMAPASAPAGTVAVIQEYRARGPMTSLLLGVVGLDDAFAIMIYAFAAAIARVLLSHGETTFMSLMAGPVLEIIGGLAVGAAVGFGLRVLLRNRHDHGDILTLSLGAILLTTGLANVLGLSLILANLAVGVILANLAPRETERSYRSVEQITQPIYVLFFVIAGAHLNIPLLAKLSLLGPLYIVGRSFGKYTGAAIGASIARAEPVVRKNLGLGLFSQAGVAIGLALTVANEFRAPQYGELGQQLATLTINTIAATTIVFEIVGPITTKIALDRAGEIPATASPQGDPA
jgi:Kef-type K+ transport system membrane component KefB